MGFLSFGAGVAFLGLLASATALPLTRSQRSSTLLALQFANVLEQLESTFYAQALQKFNPSDFMQVGFSSPQIPLQQFQVIASDESIHATTLESAITALGSSTIQGCSFDVSSLLTDVATMVASARLVENVGVSAYLAALTLISDEVLSTAAATIMTVEARHQTILNVLSGTVAIPQAFDVALNPSEVLALTGGLISDCNLGIPSNVPLQVNNFGPVRTGMTLSFTSAALTATVEKTDNLFCQFLAGGFPFSISQPLSECNIPSNLAGPVYVFVTDSSQPLLNNVRDAATGTIVAGPALLFVDGQEDALGMAARPSLNSTVAIIATTAATSSAPCVISPAPPQSSGAVNSSTTTTFSMSSPPVISTAPPQSSGAVNSSTTTTFSMSSPPVISTAPPQSSGAVSSSTTTTFSMSSPPVISTAPPQSSGTVNSSTMTAAYSTSSAVPNNAMVFTTIISPSEASAIIVSVMANMYTT